MKRGQLAKIRPRNVAKVRCRFGCGHARKARISIVLTSYDEAMRCPSCGRVAAIVVVGFVSR